MSSKFVVSFYSDKKLLVMPIPSPHFHSLPEETASADMIRYWRTPFSACWHWGYSRFFVVSFGTLDVCGRLISKNTKHQNHNHEQETHPARSHLHSNYNARERAGTLCFHRIHTINPAIRHKLREMRILGTEEMPSFDRSPDFSHDTSRAGSRPLVISN